MTMLSSEYGEVREIRPSVTASRQNVEPQPGLAHPAREAMSLGRSSTARGEFAPTEAKFHDQQRGKGEGDHADGGEGVAKMAPVAGPEVQHAAGDEGKRDGVGTD